VASDRRKALLAGSAFGLAVALATAVVAAVITLTTTTAVGAGVAVLNAPCDTSYQINLTYPVWDDTAQAYVVTGFVVSGLDWQPCTSSLIQVNAVDANGASLADALIVVVDGFYNWSTPVPVNSVTEIASVIYEP
jgi:hypothetical protein